MRRKIAVLGSLLAAGLLRASSAQAAASLNVGSATGSAGDVVGINVTLSVDSGVNVAGTQNDLAFGSDLTVNTKANGKPDCTVNPDIDKTATSFAFRTTGCATGSTCVRALVLSTDNTDPIPTGSALYTCRVTISSSATNGAKPIVISGIIASDPTGGRVADAAGSDGSVSVGGGAVTPTPGPVGCDSPQPPPAGPAIYVVDQSPATLGAGTLSVNLASGGQDVAGTQNDLAFPAGVTVGTKANGKPDCAVNPAIDKTATSFAFRTTGCDAGSTCVRALVLSTDNTDPIPTGSALYTCNVTIGSAGGTIAVTGVILSTPAGGRVSNATGQNGVICVGGGATPTAVPTAESCASPQAPPAGPAIYVVDQSPVIAGTALSVKLATGGQAVAGTQNDLTFPGGVTVGTKANGKPDCTVNSAIDKSATSFAFRTTGCDAGSQCVRALVLSTDNTDAIVDGSVLYTCNVTVGSGGTVAVGGVILSTPAGGRVSGATGQNGIFCIPGAVNTPTPQIATPTAPPTLTATRAAATNTPAQATNTPAQATRTATATVRATNTAPSGTPSLLEDEGGCHIGSSASSNSWLLLLPLAGLLIARRRPR